MHMIVIIIQMELHDEIVLVIEIRIVFVLFVPHKLLSTTTEYGM